MKQLKIILISILCGIFLLLCGVLVWGITGFGFKINGNSNNNITFGDYRKVLEVEVPAERIEVLNLFFDKNSNDIYFYESKSEQILIEEYVNMELSEKEETKVTETDKVLTLDSPRRNTGVINWGINSKSGYVKVYLPASYEGNLNVTVLSGDIDSNTDFILDKDAKFTVSSTSGDINLLKAEAKTVDISSVSGDIEAEAITAEINISTTSGDIDISACTGNCEADTVSGDIDINSVSGNVDFSTTSGDVSVGECLGGGRTSTVSGDVELHFVKLYENLSVSTTSGIISIYIPQNATVQFDAQTTSGDINTFFDDVLSFNKKGNHASGTYGDGEAVLMEVDSTSGDVHIRQN